MAQAVVMVMQLSEIFRCPAIAPVDPASWPLGWITQSKRDLFGPCLLLKLVKKSVSTGS